MPTRLMPDKPITAAWPELLPNRGLVLKAARGEPVWVRQACTLQDVPGCIELAHKRSMEGCHVVGFVSYEAAPAFDSTLPVANAQADLPLTAWFAFEPSQIAEIEPVSGQAA
ncbi:MAG: hypothetical protein R3194_12295, partial [Limnobacter sp.]|nr:hypothetical protein [Limnobacter sp.]